MRFLSEVHQSFGRMATRGYDKEFLWKLSDIFKDNEFDAVIGLEYLKVIHLNDSKNQLGSHKDRHENIGFGNIGFNALLKVLNDKRFEQIPKILETPYVSVSKLESYPPYKEEIEMLKKQTFNENLKEEVIKNHMD